MYPHATEPRFQKRPEERPRELLAAALEVFAENGYRSTRLEEVAARAGVSKGTVYLYFRNKEDLLLQAMSYYLEVCNELTLEKMQSVQGSCAERLEAALRMLWEGASEPVWGRVYRLVSSEIVVEHPTVFRAWVENGAEPVWSLLAGIVERGQRAGEFRTDVSARDLVRVFATGLMQQVFFERHTLVGDAAPADMPGMLESSIRVFLRGLRPL